MPVNGDYTKQGGLNLLLYQPLKMYIISPRITASDSPFLNASNTGLGNVLFQIASCYGLARETGNIPAWNKVSEFAESLYSRFGLKHKDTIFRNCVGRINVAFRQIKEESIYGYSHTLLQTLQKTKEPLEIHGYLECLDYFNKYRNDIVVLFSPDRPSFNMIQQDFPILFDTNYTAVSIHFRGNEYLNNSGILKPWDYTFYRNAVQYIKERVTNPVFLIFSDDMETIHPSFLNECGTYQKISHKEDYIELWCMSLCMHSIVSHSTFSFWGAYLNTNPDKIVLYNKNQGKPYHAEFIPL